MTMIFNLGSINIDHVYRVPRFAKPGETLSTSSYQQFAGGKGLNQSVALARAGVQVSHVGACAPASEFCLELMRSAGVHIAFVQADAPVSGHAIITIDEAGENQILIVPGANRSIPTDVIDKALNQTQPGDWWVMQNETNAQLETAREARARGAQVAYSAAPFDPAEVKCMISHIDLLAVNESEAQAVQSELKSTPEQWDCQVLMTLGENGAKFWDGECWHRCAAVQTTVVDTTGAGDTFLGFFLASLQTQSPDQALRVASRAAAIQVARPGAADAIPRLEECL